MQGLVWCYWSCIDICIPYCTLFGGKSQDLLIMWYQWHFFAYFTWSFMDYIGSWMVVGLEWILTHMVGMFVGYSHFCYLSALYPHIIFVHETLVPPWKYLKYCLSRTKNVTPLKNPYQCIYQMEVCIYVLYELTNPSWVLPQENNWLGIHGGCATTSCITSSSSLPSSLHSIYCTYSMIVL